VLLGLSRGIALAYDSPRVGKPELRLALRVALDCLPVIRRRVIAGLVQGAFKDGGDEALSTSALAGSAQFSTGSIRRALEDLQALGVVTCHKVGSGRADWWELGEEWVKTFRLLTDAADLCGNAPDDADRAEETVSEKSEGPTHTTNGAAAAEEDEEIFTWT
jgi:DNA-binding PadR family transcriptional regulator